jgi:hypothetical protein
VSQNHVWGIGCVTTGAGRVSWAVTNAEVDAEVDACAEHLRSLGVGSDDLVLLVSRLSEAIHVAPLERAAAAVGALYSSADATEGDAFRVAALARQLRPVAVLGINGVVVGVLTSPDDAFDGAPVVAVTDVAAYRALSMAGLEPRWWLQLGPTNAFECGERAGAHIDHERWRVRRDDAGIVRLTAIGDRLTPCVDLDTALAADVIDTACPCGRPGPRVRPSSS